jgi:Fe-S cluster assembly protein SufD
MILKPQYQFAKDKTQLSKSDIEKFDILELDFDRLVFINGFLSQALSKISDKKIQVKALAQANKEELEQHLAQYATFDQLHDGLTALNTAFFQSGYLISIPDNIKFKKPLLLFYVSNARKANVFYQPRNLILVGSKSQASIIEAYQTIGDKQSWINQVNELIIEKGADLQYYCLQNDQKKSYLTARTEINQAANSKLSSLAITLNTNFVRNDLSVHQNGSKAKAKLNGLYLLKGRQHLDNHTVIEHFSPETSSEELYKGILDNRATGVFNGKIIIQAKAKNSKAQQINKNILLSDNAMMNTKPQLEIFTDEVECSHGASTGPIDHQALFYLKSRGIADDEAQRLLMQGFVREIIDQVKNQQFKQYLINQIF